MKIKEILDKLHSGEIVPRYHKATGMIQFYLTDDVRIHIFHPSLPAQPEEFGNRHNHRFELHSTVLYGALTDVALKPVPSYYIGRFTRWQVQPAHEGVALPVRADDIKYDLTIDDIRVIQQGSSYSIPKWSYHESRPHGLTITVVRKHDQEEKQASIFAHRGQGPEHAMEHSVSPITLKHYVTAALYGLGVWQEQMIAHQLEIAKNGA